MAEKKNRRASVQLNVRLEPAEAALIKRVIPKRLSPGRHREPAGRARPQARSPDADYHRGRRHCCIDPTNSEGALAGAPNAQAHIITRSMIMFAWIGQAVTLRPGVS